VSAGALTAQPIEIGQAMLSALTTSSEPLLFPCAENSQVALQQELQMLAQRTQLDRLLVYSLLDSTQARTPDGTTALILVLGVTKARARFHAAVTRESPALPLLSILLSQTVTALCNANLVGELVTERDSLERKVAARTAELSAANEGLTFALTKARESERVKMEFLANVSHELRTPLNSIINIPDGLLEEFPTVAAALCPGCAAQFQLEPGEVLAASTPCPSCGATLEPAAAVIYQGEPPQTREYLETVVRCGRHLLDVVNDILDVSRLEAGRVELHESVVSLLELHNDVQQAVSALASERELRLEFPKISASLTIRGDRLRLAQVLINLTGNAIKFSHPGGRVMVRVESTPEKVRWEVADQGIGIAPENQERIFESFRQVEGGDTRRYGGSGLGLAITRQLVELHHGRVWVRSALGEGSTFVVEIPHRPQPPLSATPETSP
jgi:signal transduction histidine kinase